MPARSRIIVDRSPQGTLLAKYGIGQIQEIFADPLQHELPTAWKQTTLMGKNLSRCDGTCNPIIR